MLNSESEKIKSKETQVEKKKSSSWLEIIAVYLKPAALRMLVLGFVAGLPAPLVFGTLSFRLRELGINRTTITLFSWILLLYSLKLLWAPLMDRIQLPLLYRCLGRRRSWLFFAQLIVIVGLVGMALVNPNVNLNALVLFTFVVTFGSTLQDISIDAYRVESADAALQPALSATYLTGYRLAMLVAGAGGLWLAAQVDKGLITWATLEQSAQNLLTASFGGSLQFSWFLVYSSMALIMLGCLLFTLFFPEPAVYQTRTAYKGAGDFIKNVIVAPFAAFFQRYQQQAFLLLLLIALYRISDILGGAMANIFYVDSGYSKEQVAFITKFYGTAMTIFGATFCGALIYRYGLKKIMILGVLGAISNNLLYALLSYIGPSIYFLALVISVDNLTAGIAGTCLIVFLTSLITSTKYVAPQYAMFSSVLLFFPKLLAGFSGWFVDAYGYASFYIFAASLSLPILYLIYLLGDVLTSAESQGK